MIDKKIIQTVNRGKDAYFLMEKFDIPQATAFRLVKRIRNGQLERKPGSGRRPRYVWDTSDVRRFLLAGPFAAKAGEKLWTVRSIQASLKTALGLNVSLDTIRRRLNRSGLVLDFPVDCLTRLAGYGESTTTGSRCFFIAQAELDLHSLATNRRVDAESSERLHILYALDRRKKILFHCFRREANSRDLIGFLKELIACHPDRLIVCGTRLSLYGLAVFLKRSKSNLSILKLD